MALPTADCVRGMPLGDKLDAIYCAALESAANAGADIASLVTCECVKGEPLPDKWDSIYAALYAWTLVI